MTPSSKKTIITPARVIALGFILVILTGSVLLSLPAAHSGNGKVEYLDALFTSVSCVCVTGLSTVELGVAFSTFGQVVALILIQIGGLGITSLGVGVFVLLGGKIRRRNSSIVKEALNYQTWNGIAPLIRSVIIMDFSFEIAGAIAFFFSFKKEYPTGKAIWMSAFHSISSFNNAGFDIIGHGNSIGDYTGDIYFNIVTALMIIFGGLGFFVIRELITHRKKEKFSLHTKIVLMMTGILLIAGTLIIKLTERENISWLGAFFASTTARTAGFATYPLSGFSNAGLLVMCALMFIGASPGSTGGGIKTTTIYALIKSLMATSSGKEARSFSKKIPDNILYKSFIIVSFGLLWAIMTSVLMCMFETGVSMRDAIFECFSAFGTVGLSTGITPSLTNASKILIIITMYIGRLGPLTIATMFAKEKKSGVSRPEESFPIG